MTAKIAEYFPIWANIYYVRARILRQSMANKYKIIDSKVGDDLRPSVDNPMAHALLGQWHFGE